MTSIYLLLLPVLNFLQDSLAHAVADEMQKIYTKELRPTPVPLTVPGEAIDEEDVCSFILLQFCPFKYLC